VALSAYSRQRLAVMLGSQPQANELADIIDAQTGTVGADMKRRLQLALGPLAGATAATKFAAGATLTDYVEGELTKAIGETAAKEIIALQDA